MGNPEDNKKDAREGIIGAGNVNGDPDPHRKKSDTPNRGGDWDDHYDTPPNHEDTPPHHDKTPNHDDKQPHGDKCW